MALNDMQFLDSSWHHFKVWLAIIRTRRVREMEIRTNFLLGIGREILWFGVFLFVIEVVFQNAESLAGWSQAEVLVVLALSRLLEGGMNILFIRNIGEIPFSVNDGTFDFLLVKPISAQWHAAFKRFMFYNFGTFGTGVALFAYVLLLPEVSLSVPAVGVLILLVFLGVIIFYSLLLLVATLGFFLERLEAVWAFFHLFSEPLTMPFDIFPRGARVAMTYVVPLAFVVFVPAQAVTQRLSSWQLPLAVGIAVVTFVVTQLFWRAGLRRYSSASS